MFNKKFCYQFLVFIFASEKSKPSQKQRLLGMIDENLFSSAISPFEGVELFSKIENASDTEMVEILFNRLSTHVLDALSSKSHVKHGIEQEEPLSFDQLGLGSFFGDLSFTSDGTEYKVRELSPAVALQVLPHLSDNFPVESEEESEGQEA